MQMMHPPDPSLIIRPVDVSEVRMPTPEMESVVCRLENCSLGTFGEASEVYGRSILIMQFRIGISYAHAASFVKYAMDSSHMRELIQEIATDRHGQIKLMDLAFGVMSLKRLLLRRFHANIKSIPDVRLDPTIAAPESGLFDNAYAAMVNAADERAFSVVTNPSEAVVAFMIRGVSESAVEARTRGWHSEIPFEDNTPTLRWVSNLCANWVKKGAPVFADFNFADFNFAVKLKMAKDCLGELEALIDALGDVPLDYVGGTSLSAAVLKLQRVPIR